MKTLFLILIITFSTFAQFDFPPPPPIDEPPGTVIVYCRGMQEVDENGNPVPDDPNCVPDPSTGSTGGIEGFFANWF